MAALLSGFIYSSEGQEIYLRRPSHYSLPDKCLTFAEARPPWILRASYSLEKTCALLKQAPRCKAACWAPPFGSVMKSPGFCVVHRLWSCSGITGSWPSASSQRCARRGPACAPAVLPLLVDTLCG